MIIQCQHGTKAEVVFSMDLYCFLLWVIGKSKVPVDLILKICHRCLKREFHCSNYAFFNKVVERVYETYETYYAPATYLKTPKFTRHAIQAALEYVFQEISQVWIYEKQYDQETKKFRRAVMVTLKEWFTFRNSSVLSCVKIVASFIFIHWDDNFQMRFWDYVCNLDLWK